MRRILPVAITFAGLSLSTGGAGDSAGSYTCCGSNARAAPAGDNTALPSSSLSTATAAT
jgi:hypothetical protein